MKAEKIVARLRAFLPAELRDTQRRLHRHGRVHPDKAVHDVRKLIKRLRAALRLAADTAPEKALDAIGIPLRDAAHALGPLRDHLVLSETARTIVLRGEEPPPQPAAPSAAPILKQAGTGLRKAAAALSHLLQEGFDPQGVRKGLRAIYKRARRAMKQAAKTASDEDLHAWRRRAKDLFYVLELIEAPDRLTKKLKRLTQILGEDHDLATFIAHHNPTADLAAHGHLLKRARKRRAPLQKKAFRLGEKLLAQRPRDFVRDASQ